MDGIILTFVSVHVQLLCVSALASLTFLLAALAIVFPWHVAPSPNYCGM